MRGITIPDAVGHDLVKLKPQCDGTAAESVYKLRVQERLAAREAEDVDAGSVGVFQKAKRSFNLQPIRPFDGYAAVRAGQVALKCSSEGHIVGPKGARAAANRTAGVAREGHPRVSKS